MTTSKTEEQPLVAAPDALTENTAQAPAEESYDFDRILAGDEAYTKEVNEKLAAEVPQSEQPTEEKAEKPKEEAAAAEAPAAPVADPDEVVETIVYRGQEMPVKRSQMKDLLQKGRHLETRLEEVSPLLALAREVPELAEKLRTPEGRKQVIERIRQQERAQQQVEDDVPEVEGYDKDDVRAVDKVVRARMKALGVAPEQAGRPSPEQIAAQERDQQDMAAKTRITLESLRTVDPNYERNMELLKEVVQEVERTAPPEQFRQFYAIINDPRKIDPATGRPAFLNFYADIDRERTRRESLEKPTVPVIPAIPRKVQTPSGRMAPGSAISPSASVSAGVLKFESQSDFDRAFNEALARG